MSPARKWNESVNEFPPRWPASRGDLDISLGQIDQRIIGNRGIEFKGLFYNSRELSTLRRKLPPRQKVTIKYMPDDIGSIYVRDPLSADYVLVPALDQAYARGKTLWLHEVILKYAKEHTNGRVDREAILRAERAIQKVVDKALVKPNKRTNKHLARALNIKQQPPATGEPSRPLADESDIPGEIQVVRDVGEPPIAFTSEAPAVPWPPVNTDLPDDDSWGVEYSPGSPTTR